MGGAPAAWWSWRRKGWAGQKIQPPWRPFPVAPDGATSPISWHGSPPDRRAPCLFLFKERGRPISLPRAYLFCFLIFQSSDFTAFFHLASSSQQEELFPLLFKPQLRKDRGRCSGWEAWGWLCISQVGLGASHSNLGSASWDFSFYQSHLPSHYPAAPGPSRSRVWMRQGENLRWRGAGSQEGGWDSQYGNSWWTWGPLCLAAIICLSPLILG